MVVCRYKSSVSSTARHSIDTMLVSIFLQAKLLWIKRIAPPLACMTYFNELPDGWNCLWEPEIVCEVGVDL